MTSILALDLGTNTGFASFSGGNVVSGTWKLDRAEEKCACSEEIPLVRECRLYTRVFEVLKSPQFAGGMLAYEDVRFGTYVLATQCWAGLRAAALLAARAAGIREVLLVSVGTLKKHATGHGAAKKNMMAAAWVRHNPDTTLNSRGRAVRHDGVVLGEDEVDALWILDYARTCQKHTQ